MDLNLSAYVKYSSHTLTPPRYNFVRVFMSTMWHACFWRSHFCVNLGGYSWVTQCRATTGQPPKISSLIYSPEHLEYSCSDLPLSCGALCTRVAATRRNTRIAVFMMTRVCTAVCLMTEWSSGSLCWNIYICGYLRKDGSRIKETLSHVYPELEDISSTKEGFCPRAV
jgi:hypothetical protein